MDRGRPVGVTSLALGTASPLILISEWERRGFEGWAFRCIRNWVDGRGQRAVSVLTWGWR